MAADRRTKQGIGRVGPDPLTLQAQVDWAAEPPPALVELRREELVHARRATRTKAVVFGVGIVGFMTLAVMTLVVGRVVPGLGVTLFLAGGCIRWMIPTIRAAREVTRQLESLDRRPALPTARVVIREH